MPPTRKREAALVRSGVDGERQGEGEPGCKNLTQGDLPYKKQYVKSPTCEGMEKKNGRTPKSPTMLPVQARRYGTSNPVMAVFGFPFVVPHGCGSPLFAEPAAKLAQYGALP